MRCARPVTLSSATLVRAAICLHFARPSTSVTQAIATPLHCAPGLQHSTLIVDWIPRVDWSRFLLWEPPSALETHAPQPGAPYRSRNSDPPLCQPRDPMLGLATAVHAVHRFPFLSPVTHAPRSAAPPGPFRPRLSLLGILLQRSDECTRAPRAIHQFLGKPPLAIAASYRLTGLSHVCSITHLIWPASFDSSFTRHAWRLTASHTAYC